MHHFPQMQHNPVSDTEKYKTTALLQFLNLKWQPTVTTECSGYSTKDTNWV